ncbi:MAG: AEC family transporter [Candidatus Omnitrophica bacterium]|nr:AEC family transporter [Candidatus Omnitrophota bacterium]
MVGQLGFSWGLFIGSMVTGWWLGHRRVLTEERASRILRVAIKWLSPIVLTLSFWTLPITGQRLVWLPIIGGVVCLAALWPAWGYARWARLTKPQVGSLLTCAMFSNVGYIGALLAFAFFGESGYGLAVWYLVYFSPLFYLVGMTIAKRFGDPTSSSMAQSPFSDELRLRAFLGMALGLILNLAKCPRPEILGVINHVLIPVDTAIHLTAIGSQISLASPTASWRHGLAMCAIKFVYSPLVGWLLAWAVRLEGLPKFIVLLQASMPVAVSPLMLAVVFRLDRKLASALWLWTNLLAIPWLFLYVPLIR